MLQYVICKFNMRQCSVKRLTIAVRQSICDVNFIMTILISFRKPTCWGRCSRRNSLSSVSVGSEGSSKVPNDSFWGILKISYPAGTTADCGTRDGSEKKGGKKKSWVTLRLTFNLDFFGFLFSIMSNCGRSCAKVFANKVVVFWQIWTVTIVLLF